MQHKPDDLYSGVYAILDDAKPDRRLVKLYKGSHGSQQPHPAVLDFMEFFAARRQGLVGYLCHKARSGGALEEADLEDLAAYQEQHQPRISVEAAFALTADLLRADGEPDVSVLRRVARREHRLGAYRGGSSGFDEEGRAFAAAHLRNSGVPCVPEQVKVFSGGAKGAFMALCGALMSERRYDEVERRGGRMLAPAGYYQSLRMIPAVFGGVIDVVPRLDGGAVAAWLETTPAGGRCIYVPLVNNANGSVLSRRRALEIAEVVLRHNQKNPDDPVFVLGDDVYVDSYLQFGMKPTPIGSVSGLDVEDASLGHMHQWTLSVATPSKTFALPTSRVAFAVTGNRDLAEAVSHYRTVLSHGRVPVANELAAAAALCLTPREWVTGWNDVYRRAFRELRDRLGVINKHLGYEAFSIDHPEGGWFFLLKVDRQLMPGAVSSVDAYAALLHYGQGERDSGIALLPGELFGWRECAQSFRLRGSLAVGPKVLEEFALRLQAAAQVFDGPQGATVLEQAMRRARRVAPVDGILRALRY